MATISKLKLEIKKGSSVSDVTISYALCFTHCERMAKSVFVEHVSLRADDPIDNHLCSLGNTCIKASKACIPRKFTRKIKNSILNEDDRIFNRGDEVYARVRITPFKPSGKKADSNIISSHF